MAYVYDDEPCPERGPGLSHSLDGEPGSRCPDCSVQVFPAEFRSRAVNGIVDIGVASRLSALGISNGQNGELAPDCIIDHESLGDGALCGRCGISHEGKYTTLGTMPTGPAWEVGRSWNGDGGLSARDQRKLTFASLHPGREVTIP